MLPIISSQPVFTPANIQGGIAWYDASVTPVGAVASWADQFGNGNAATQATSARRPICTANQQNSKNALRFTGTNSSYLIGPNAFYTIPAGDNTVFVVLEIDDVGVNTHILSIGVTGEYLIFNSATSGRVNAQQPNEIDLNGVTKNIYNTFLFRRNGGTAFLSANGGAEVSGVASNQSVAAATIGCFSDQSGGFITAGYAEIIAYNRNLSTTEITAVNSYLKNKWGTP